MRININTEGEQMDPYQIGRNQVSKKFKMAFEILLTPEYFEGSEYGKYYNSFDEDGKSTIYVPQPKTEKEITDFLDNPNHDIHYLVGYAGVGKTTVIRNYFRVFNRDVVSNNGNLILYHSFYSMAPDLESIDKSVISSLKNAINYLTGYKDTLTRILDNDEKYYNDFYNFILSNNQALLNEYPNNSKSIRKLKKGNPKITILDFLEEHNTMAYTLMELKFCLTKNKKKYDNFVIIFDDIESKEIQYHNEIVSIAETIKKCLSANKENAYTCKIIVSLRSTTCRLRNRHIEEAFRNIPENQLTIKTEVPNLSEVVTKRLNEIIKHEDVINSIGNIDSWKTSYKVLEHILTKLYSKYDETIPKLTHNNIFKSMSLLMKIVTNKRYFGKYEVYLENGAFILSNSSYDNIKNDDVFYALALGENKYYHDCEDYYLSNIIHSHIEDGYECELIGLYLINYFINTKYNGNSLYGSKYESERAYDITKKILSIYAKNLNKEFKNSLAGKIDFMLGFLYRGGILLQSIRDIEQDENPLSERKYDNRYLLYLSLRGKMLYKLLSENSLLLELYLDDIDLDDSFGTYDRNILRKKEILGFCIDYVELLFSKEKVYISNALDRIDLYIQYFGKDYIVSKLIKGLKESIIILYQNYQYDTDELFGRINELINNINEYSAELRKINTKATFNNIDLLYLKN